MVGWKAEMKVATMGYVTVERKAVEMVAMMVVLMAVLKDH